MSIVLLGSTSGSCTLQEQAVAGTTTLTLPTFNGTIGLLVSGTAVASTSGTSIDYTNIPTGVRRITVMFNGVSTNGTSVVQIQLGSGSPTTTGYNIGASSSPNATAPTVTQPTTGFPIIVDGNAAYTRQGFIVFTNVSGNIWVGSGVGGENVGGRYWTCGGSISLAGVLDRVRITTVNGTDTFDAGSINILYE